MSQSAQRIFAGFACAIALVFGVATQSVFAPVANAEQHGVDLIQVCKENYKQPRAKVGSLPLHFDPYSMYCYLDQPGGSAGLPIAVGISSTQVDLGDLDVQAYCSKHWPGSSANGRMMGPFPYWTCDT